MIPDGVRNLTSSYRPESPGEFVGQNATNPQRPEQDAIGGKRVELTEVISRNQ